MSGAAIAVAVAVTLGWAAAAGADVITLPATKATVEVDASWQRVVRDRVVAGFRTEDGRTLAITRAPIPNTDAWRARTRDAYADDVERGIARAVDGYRRLTRRVRVVNGVPALDLEARGRRATLVIRILLFRTYALGLAIEVPRGADLSSARTVAATFAPPAPATRDGRSPH